MSMKERQSQSMTKALTGSQYVCLMAGNMVTAGGATVVAALLWRYSPRFRQAQARWATWEAVRAADRKLAAEYERFQRL